MCSFTCFHWLSFWLETQGGSWYIKPWGGNVANEQSLEQLDQQLLGLGFTTVLCMCTNKYVGYWSSDCASWGSPKAFHMCFLKSVNLCCTGGVHTWVALNENKQHCYAAACFPKVPHFPPVPHLCSLICSYLLIIFTFSDTFPCIHSHSSFRVVAQQYICLFH